MKNTTLIFSMLFLASCNGNNNKLETLQDELMEIHDEVMPKMGEIMSLKEELSNNLKTMDSTTANYKTAKVVSDSLSNLLVEADNGMMDWMDEYNADTLKAISAEDGEKYLLEEKNKINAVKETTLKNIEAVKKYLKK